MESLSSCLRRVTRARNASCLATSSCAAGALVASLLAAPPATAEQTVTVTIHELELDDGDIDAGVHLFPGLIQYQPIFGDFDFQPSSTVRPPGWNTRYGVCQFAPTPTLGDDCHLFIRNPDWIFSTTVDETAGPILFRFVITDEVNDTSTWPLALAPADTFAGLHERGLYLVIDPLNESWFVRSNPGVLNPTTSSGDLGAFTLANDLNAIARFSVDFTCVPSQEICDGEDNDCDGAVDAEDVDLLLPPLTCPGGVAGCTFAIPQACVAGVPTGACPAPDPSETICNDRDDDCDGQVDEGATSAAEICDGMDNDCDDLIDDADPNFVSPTIACPGLGGSCTTELVTACVGGVPDPTCPTPDPSETACNMVDDDCDGQTDEGAFLALEVCDGVDNDCDGAVDDADSEFFEPTFACPGVGTECTFNVPAACVSGEPEPLSPCPAPDASESVCNGFDDDCNGRIDEGYEIERRSTLEGGACSTTVTYCDRVDGIERTTPPIPGDGSPEVPDGLNNDCTDDAIDECDPGQTDWWCGCSGGDLEFVVDVLDDIHTMPDPNNPGALIPDPDAAASYCLPTSEPSTGMCNLRGVFRRAEQLDFLGCRVVARLPAGTIVPMDELRLSAGSLLLQGSGSDPSEETCGPDDPVTCTPASTAITTTNPCTVDQRNGDNRSCSCASSSNYRLINAISDRQMAHSLSLELEDLILRGGTLTESADFGPGTAGGAVVVRGGAFAARNVFVRDSRARGLGAGLALFDSPMVEIIDSVVAENMNTQGLSIFGETCSYIGDAGGQTGFGAGIYLTGVEQASIERSAIIGNVGPDGAGITSRLANLAITNSTISGNVAGGAGGGLWFWRSNVSLLFNTIARNRAAQGDPFTDCARNGGGIFGFSSTTGPVSTLAAYGNVIAENTASLVSGLNPDCITDPGSSCGDPVAVEAGYNFVGETGPNCTGLQDAAGTLSGDPVLTPPEDTPLAGNSSAELVHELSAGSPALAAYPAVPPAPAPPCLTATAGTDQRNALRPTAGPCAMGAWENSSTFAGFSASPLFRGVFVGGELIIRDRADVLADITAGSFSIGFDSIVSGDATTSGNGFVSERADLLGDAILGGVLSGDRDAVSGDIVEGQALVLPELPVREGGSSGPDIVVPHDGLRMLTPGEYGNVVVRSRATLVLADAGLYRFVSLRFEPDGFLRIAGNFDVALAVDGDVVLGDRFNMAVNNQSTLNSDHLFLYSSGTLVELGHDLAMVGNVEAPFAHVEIRDRAFVRGSVVGESVTIGFDTIVGPRAGSGE